MALPWFVLTMALLCFDLTCLDYGLALPCLDLTMDLLCFDLTYLDYGLALPITLPCLCFALP